MHWANNMFVVTHFDKHGTKEWLTLGKFTSADEAARCYDKHVKATDGTKAKLNFPDFTTGTGDSSTVVIYRTGWVICTVWLRTESQERCVGREWDIVRNESCPEVVRRATVGRVANTGKVCVY